MHFFDYSLWNHYVNVLSHYYRWHDFFTCLLLCLRLGHLSYLFIIFLLCTFCTLTTLIYIKKQDTRFLSCQAKLKYVLGD